MDHATEELGISSEEFERRRERSRQLLRDHGLSAAVIAGRSFYDRVGDLAYLTGHYPPFPATGFIGNARGLGHSLLLLPIEHDPTLLVDGHWRDDLVSLNDVRPSGNLVTSLAALLAEKGLHGEEVGLVGADILPTRFMREVEILCPRWRTRDLDDEFRSLRRVKSAAEIALLRSSAVVAEHGLKSAAAAIRPGLTERHLAVVGISATMAAGADFVRYFRVHSGPWSARASRWPPATDRVIEEGELVLLDMIGAARGYQFDVMRMGVAGTPTRDVRDLLDAVNEATLAAVDAARPGALAGDVARRARKTLSERGFGEFASGFAGHGIGLETVEAPILVEESEETLAVGDVLCVEPAVWIKGRQGASIEQEIVISPSKAELLTDSPTVLW